MAVLVAAALLVASLVVIEIVLRRLGVASFPLFEAAEQGGYRMQPD